MKVPVVIIGAGPAGTLLSLMLRQAGIDNVVLELRSRDYVVGRVRAGVLEWSTVETLRQFGLGARMDAEGHVHDLIDIAWSGHGLVSIDTVARVGKQMMGYGQTELQRDLYDAADAAGATIVFEATDIELHDVTSSTPSVTYRANGVAERIECDFIAGCDGFHGVSRDVDPGRPPAPSSPRTTRSAGSGSCRRHRRCRCSPTPATSGGSPCARDGRRCSAATTCRRR